jgi:hypothetical protein
MNYKALVIGTLSQDSFVSVNKTLARRLGFVEAGLLAELIFTHKGVAANNSFFDEGKQGEWFYLTQPKVEEQLGIKRREHDTAIKNLIGANVILKKQLGIPAKSHYLINWKVIVDIVDNSDETPPEPAPQSGCTKRTSKGGRNVHPSVDETYIQESTECTSIHINKKKLEEKEIKQINNKNLVNKGFQKNVANYLSKDDVTEIANTYYPNFAAGRWSKKQWVALIEQFASECLDKKIKKPRNYIYASLERMAYAHDFKNGRIEFEYKGESSVPFYNWITTLEETSWED